MKNEDVESSHERNDMSVISEGAMMSSYITNPVGKLQERMMGLKGGVLPVYQLIKVSSFLIHCSADVM